MKTKVWMLIIMLIPIMMSCGKDNESGSDDSSSTTATVSSLSDYGISISESQESYSNATVLLVSVNCTTTSSTYSSMISLLQTYLTELQSTTTVTYNGSTYTTEGHIYAVKVALNTLNNYYNSSYNYYGTTTTTTFSCPSSTLGQGVSLLY